MDITTAFQHAWVSLQDLYHCEESKELLSLALDDESARTALYLSFEPVLGEEAGRNGRVLNEFLPTLQSLLSEAIAGAGISDKRNFFVEGVKRLIRNDLQLRKSFTMAECLAFIGVCDKTTRSDLNALDQLTGTYLCLSVLEAETEFQVVSALAAHREALSLLVR